MIGAPEGALGLATGNGWMNSEIFPKVLEHIIKHVRPTKERQIILIMDAHCSHLSVIARKMAKANFIHLIILPPHTSNKTQPLDRTVFGLFKTFFNTAANGFMLQNPGKGITIYDMALLMSDAWTKAATPMNIMSGFRASGIWPLDPHVFDDTDFLPSAVTDRPQPVDKDLTSSQNQPGPS
ncbi:tigger transposable element-derived protein [Elysia marginata]|uniref:Tigger transposable element-derived protein n=1 Tax=Elysia marginata TaxID=1093978 RepID=A0AAV4GZE7_9GAST|nr:tigger transposable element-derived protein [Elysia marginata]